MDEGDRTPSLRNLAESLSNDDEDIYDDGSKLLIGMFL